MNASHDAPGPRAPSRPSNPRSLLHLEGATLLAGASVWFFLSGGSLLLFALLLFVPDLSMLGYARGPRVGAIVYNLVHAYPLPALLVLLAHLTGTPILLHVALVWLAHIGVDRMLGYGLKYASSFRDTHLQRV